MKKLFGFILITLALAAVLYFGFLWLVGKQEKKMVELEQKIHYLKKETVPLRFKILEKDNSNIKFVLKFLDQYEKEIVRDTIQLEGQELSFDFYVVPVEDSLQNKIQIAFPWKVFTNKMAPKDGKLLFDYYDIKGFPRVFGDSIAIKDTIYVNRMSELFAKIKAGDTENIKGISGSMVQDVESLNEFAVGHAYEIIIHTRGGIEIMEIR